MKSSEEQYRAHTKEQESQSIPTKYRLIYLQPSNYSEEAIAVGIVAQSSEGFFKADIRMSRGAIKRMCDLLDEEVIDHLDYALDNLWKLVKGLESLEKLDSKNSLLSLGRAIPARCSNPESFIKDMLQISSCMYKTFVSENAENFSITQKELTNSFRDKVTHLNAFKATQIFTKKKMQLDSRNTITVPIFGEHVFGGPISFVTQQVSSAKIQAEALIAKYSLVKKEKNRKAALYVLTPSYEMLLNHKKVERELDELEAVAKGHDVLIRHERTLDNLALALLNDEKIA